jgi:hypothetical protein
MIGRREFHTQSFRVFTKDKFMLDLYLANQKAEIYEPIDNDMIEESDIPKFLCRIYYINVKCTFVLNSLRVLLNHHCILRKDKLETEFQGAIQHTGHH